MFALRTTCRLPSASTLSTSQLRQYKDRSVSLRFEKFNGSGKTLFRQFTGQHTSSLQGGCVSRGSSNGVSQKRPTIHLIWAAVSLPLSSPLGKVPRDYLPPKNLRND